MLLAPLQEISSTISHADVRQKVLDCVSQILHTGEISSDGWPYLLDVIGAINDEQG